MLVKTTFFILLTSFISASVAAPIAQAPDAISVSGISAVASSTAAAPSASVDAANLDPEPVEEEPAEEAPGIELNVASVPTTSEPSKEEPTSIHHTTSTVHHVPVHTPTTHHVPPVHHTTSTFHHVPVHTPVHHEPPVHHTTSTFHHIPVHTTAWPWYEYKPPVHHTTTQHHVPVHTPVHDPAPVHHTTTLAHHVPVHTPVHTPAHVPEHKPVHVPTHHSFDRWGGYDSLKDFDHFYGVDNWDGYKFEQVFVKKDHDLVCKAHDIHIIQQRMLVLQEMAKRIIVETICEVEVQTIVFEQWYASLHGFGRDLRRYPGHHHQVGYDEEIVKHFPKFIKHDGSLDLDDWHFTGKDLGKHSVIVKGHNWDDKRSPTSVWRAWAAARQGWYNLYGKWF